MRTSRSTVKACRTMRSTCRCWWHGTSTGSRGRLCPATAPIRLRRTAETIEPVYSAQAIKEIGTIGDGVSAQFLLGPDGDQNPVSNGSFLLADCLGQDLGATVANGLAVSGRGLRGPVHSEYAEVKLPLDLPATGAPPTSVRAAYVSRLPKPFAASPSGTRKPWLRNWIPAPSSGRSAFGCRSGASRVTRPQRGLLRRRGRVRVRRFASFSPWRIQRNLVQRILQRRPVRYPERRVARSPESRRRD
jgi:hypothetical protein